MKRRIFAIALACAMSLSLLSACGGNDAPSGGQSSGSQAGGSSASQSQPDASTPDVSQPDASTPDASQPDVSQPADSGESGVAVSLTLNKTDVTLKSAGASFRLRYTATPDTDGIPTFTSSNPEVVTVSETGAVTAVAPGTANITVEYDGASAVCIVRCSWTETSDGSNSSSSGSGSSSKVDLQAFYDSMVSQYEFGFLELADNDLLDNMYPGMTGVSAEQCLVYITMMSMNNGEFGLVQVKDSKDVETVKAIFQARIDYMVGDGNGPGGAWYPGPTEMWANNSRVMSNGNYVMMVIHENCEDIVKAFNELF